MGVAAACHPGEALPVPGAERAGRPRTVSGSRTLRPSGVDRSCRRGAAGAGAGDATPVYIGGGRIKDLGIEVLRINGLHIGALRLEGACKGHD